MLRIKENVHLAENRPLYLNGDFVSDISTVLTWN